MLATESNLDEIAALARAAKLNGATSIEFEIEAQMGFARHVTLWEGTIGAVIGRVFENPTTPAVPDIARARNVKYFRVRMPIAAVLEAQRRRRDRENREFSVTVQESDLPDRAHRYVRSVADTMR